MKNTTKEVVLSILILIASVILPFILLITFA